MRVRLKYSVIGKIRFISHLDIMRVFFRACTRGKIPVEVSKGYSPHLKLSFGPPRSLGISSSCEWLDVFLKKEIALDEFKKNLGKGLPKGIRIETLYIVDNSLPALNVSINRAIYSIEIPEDYTVIIGSRINEFIRTNFY